jgi:hypothetical protein
MNNVTIQLKLKQRLNKLDSQDYDNIEQWQIVEAFNKGQVNWCRRQLHGLNIKQTGDEQSKAKIDDLQILLKDYKLSLIKKDKYFESNLLPTDYFEWKRISANATTECCNNKHSLVIYLVEEANIDELLRDKIKQPSYEWGETFCTLRGNHVRLYTNNKFDITDAVLVYYRQPVKIEIINCVDPYTGLTSLSDVNCEFKDDIVELLIDETAKILAGDIESFNQQQTATGQVEGNN